MNLRGNAMPRSSEEDIAQLDEFDAAFEHWFVGEGGPARLQAR